MVESGDPMIQTSSPQVNSNWAECNAVGFETQDAAFGDEFGEAMCRKSSASVKKKKSKKSDRSEANGAKKKKKKSKSSSKSDDEGGEFGNKLFEKAMAKAQSEEQAALSEAFADMCEDQEFVNAFDGGSTAEGFASFDANFGSGAMPEQAPRQRTIREDQEGDTSEWFVDNNSKGAQMQEYSRRRASVSNSVGSGSQSGQSRSRSVANTNVTPQTRGKRVPRRAKTPGTGSTSGSMVDLSSCQLDVENPANKQDEMHDSATINSEITGLTGVFSAMPVDLSSYQLDAESTANKQDEMYDSATINSEITGLTGVFSAMPPNFKEDDDSESLSADDGEALNYPKYDAAASKVMMMRTQSKKKNKPKYKVKYGPVTVREFDRILGDSPAVKTGAPISIGWKVQSLKTYPTPDAHNESRGRPAYTSMQMVLNRDQRHELLMELGYSQPDIAQAVRSTIKTKNRRRTTVNNLGVADMEEKIQSVSDGLKRMIFLKKRDR